MQWSVWRKWLEHQTSNSFLTTRKNVLITAGKSARLRNSWSKSKLSAHVFLGLCKLSRWKYSKTSVRSEYSKIYNRLIFARISSYVAQRKRHALQTKPWRMKTAWFRVTVSMQMLQMIPSNLMLWKVQSNDAYDHHLINFRFSYCFARVEGFVKWVGPGQWASSWCPQKDIPQFIDQWEN